MGGGGGGGGGGVGGLGDFQKISEIFMNSYIVSSPEKYRKKQVKLYIFFLCNNKWMLIL